MKRELNGQEYLQMLDAESGQFEVSLLIGESIKKLTIYSQQYAPISTPVSAITLSGNYNTSDISCSNGICNISLRQFDPFDPNDPNATINVFIDFYKSNSTCDVPNPPLECNLMAGINESQFSPLKAILMGDISLRISSGNISVHYVRTDLLASGPPDVAFSQNATETGFAAAWKFGSSGPDIYDKVLLKVPYPPEFENRTIVVTIPILYDNYFNVIWNFSAGNTTDQLNGTDFADYLNSPYEAYLNGTGVICSESNANLSDSLCFKDTVNGVIWMEIPHFSGVGPVISSSQGNITISVANFLINTTLGDNLAEILQINITNNGTQTDYLETLNITLNNTNNTDLAQVLLCNDSTNDNTYNDSDCSPPLRNATSTNEISFGNLHYPIPVNESKLLFIVYQNITTNSTAVNHILDATIPANGMLFNLTGTITSAFNPQGVIQIIAGQPQIYVALMNPPDSFVENNETNITFRFNVTSNVNASMTVNCTLWWNVSGVWNYTNYKYTDIPANITTISIREWNITISQVGDYIWNVRHVIFYL